MRGSIDEGNKENNKVNDFTTNNVQGKFNESSEIKDDLSNDTDIIIKDVYSEKALSDIDEEGTVKLKVIAIDIIAIALPTLVFFFCLIAQQSINMFFITSHYKEDEQKHAINGIGICSMYMNCTLVSIVIGLIAGFNVLAGNAFALKKYYLFGVYFHRAIIVTYAIALTIILIHNFTMEYGFRLLGADDNSIEFAMKYGRISMYFVLFEVFFNISYRYLNIVKKSYITIAVLIVTTSIHPFWCWLFIRKLEIGIEGAALSIVISQAITGLSLFLYIVITEPIKGTIFCINSDSFRSIKSFLKISVPSACLLCFEWWAFELQQVVVMNTGRDDKDSELSVQILSAQIYSLLYSACIGFSISGSILTSRYIAQKKLKEFKATAVLNVIICTCVMLIFVILVFLLRGKIYSFYSDDPNIIEKGQPVLPYVLLTVFLNGIKSSIQGLLIGMRKQIFASIVSFTSYYIIMIGLSILFVIKLDFGVKGVWISESIGYGLIIIAFSIYILTVNMDKVIEETLKKIHIDQKALLKMLEEEEALKPNEVDSYSEKLSEEQADKKD